jgi:hypothetical protein
MGAGWRRHQDMRDLLGERVYGSSGRLAFSSTTLPRDPPAHLQCSAEQWLHEAPPSCRPNPST